MSNNENNQNPQWFKNKEEKHELIFIAVLTFIVMFLCEFCTEVGVPLYFAVVGLPVILFGVAVIIGMIICGVL